MAERDWLLLLLSVMCRLAKNNVGDSGCIKLAETLASKRLLRWLECVAGVACERCLLWVVNTLRGMLW